jgi:uncharacterized membrane protein YfcA
MARLFLTGIAIFVLTVVTDIIWARYTQYVADGDRHQASLMATFIIGMTAVTWYAYHVTLWMAIPMLAGAYIGTYLGMRPNADRNSRPPI